MGENENAGTFLVIGNGAWGAGDSIAEAKTKFRSFGGSLSRGYALLVFSPESEFVGVDGMGQVHWKGPRPAQEFHEPKEK